jgi:hypothetical protein
MKFRLLAAAAPAPDRVHMNSFAATPDVPRHAEPAKRPTDQLAELIEQ